MKIECDIQPVICGYLDDLVKLGLWGATREEVAETLMRKALTQIIIEDGFLEAIERLG